MDILLFTKYYYRNVIMLFITVHIELLLSEALCDEESIGEGPSSGKVEQYQFLVQ